MTDINVTFHGWGHQTWGTNDYGDSNYTGLSALSSDQGEEDSIIGLNPTGQEISSTQGEEDILILFSPTGQDAASAQGEETFTISFNVTMGEITSALGTVTPSSTIAPIGQSVNAIVFDTEVWIEMVSMIDLVDNWVVAKDSGGLNSWNNSTTINNNDWS